MVQGAARVLVSEWMVKSGQGTARTWVRAHECEIAQEEEDAINPISIMANPIGDRYNARSDSGMTTILNCINTKRELSGGL